MDAKQVVLILYDRVGSFEPTSLQQTLEQIGGPGFQNPARVGESVLVYTGRWAKGVIPERHHEYHSSVVRPDGIWTDSAELTGYNPLDRLNFMFNMLKERCNSNVVVTHPSSEAAVLRALGGYEIIRA